MKDAFRGKLKSTKDSLKETQVELQKANATNVRAATTAVPSVPVGRNARKRPASEMDTDTMIGTPGDLAAAKKSKAKSTKPGEKSTFSITPFLNRTASVAPESPIQSGDKNNDEEDTGDATQSPSRLCKAGALFQSAATTEMTSSENEDILVDKSTSIVAGKSQKRAARAVPRKAMTVPKLGQVVEEADSLTMSKEVAAKVVDIKAISSETAVDKPEKKKLKRKILGGGLGKTLYEEDGDALKGDGRVGASGGFSTLGRGALGGPKVGSRAVGDFGAFSPLKKDRRAGMA